MTLQRYTNSITPASGTTVYTETLSIMQGPYSLFSITWSAVVSFNACVILQMSSDGTNWNDMGGTTEGLVIDREDGTQIWLIESTAFPYLRMEFTCNNVNAGTINWEYKGFM